AANFGAVQNRTFDMGTAVAIAVQQGASNFRCVRVTDGTDTAASVKNNATTPDITFTSKYTGTLGNKTTVTLSSGGATGSWNVQVGIPGLQPEGFTNITGTGNAFWVNVANAINNGQGPLRGPSALITATADAGTAAPAAATYTLTGGTDGATTITTATLVGVDTSPRKGMYALRGQKASVLNLADGTDSTQWSTILQFALSEGVYSVNAFPAGATVAADITAAQTAGIDSYGMKIMHGDWLYWYDQTNAVTRLVSPASFVAGLLSNLSPQNSTLNKQLFGIQGSQTFGLPGTNQAHHYSSADLGALFEAGIDVIGNPAPGGPYWSVLGGINSSLNAAENGDNYTRMTNYIASTLNAGMGVYIGRLITPSLLFDISTTIGSFLANLLQQGLLGDPNQTPRPFSVICNASNNPSSRTDLGYVRADTQIKYAAINRFFIVNLEGGQTVTVSQQAAPQG
ncbi:MAG TPA: phage tail protein, partial [Acidiphilium sp.]|nr:phage tail protein [Acidiphilium sp.]